MSDVQNPTDVPSDNDVVRRIRASNRYIVTLFSLNARTALGTKYSRVENRVLIEVARAGAITTTDLKKALRLDAGYLSRVIQKLEVKGLVERGRVESDGRLQPIRLTDEGRSVRNLLDQRADDEVRAMLANLTASEQRAVAAAYEYVTVRLGGERLRSGFTVRSPRPGEFGRVLELLTMSLGSASLWGDQAERIVAGAICQVLEKGSGGGAWVAEQDGRLVGASIVIVSDEHAEIAFVAVETVTRRHGIGSALINRSVEFARAQAVSSVSFWVPDGAASDHMLRDCGFELTDEGPPSRIAPTGMPRRQWVHVPPASDSPSVTEDWTRDLDRQAR